MPSEQPADIALEPLTNLVRCDPSQYEQQELQQEAQLLENFAVANHGCYNFTSGPAACSDEHIRFFDALVACRFLRAAWRSQLPPMHLLRVMQCLRVLTRDGMLKERFVRMQGVKILGSLLQDEAQAHFSGATSPFQIDLMSEYVSMVKRLVDQDYGLKALAANMVHNVLLQLLSCTDAQILPIVLVALWGFASKDEYYMMIAQGGALDTLLRIVQEFEPRYKQLAARLLSYLAKHPPVITMLLQLNGAGRLLGQLPSGDVELTGSLLRVICHMSGQQTTLQEIYQVGTIPILIALVDSALKDVTPSEDGQPRVLPLQRVEQMQLVCTALTRLSLDDEISAHIKQCNAISLLGKLLFVTPEIDTSDHTKALSLKTYVFRTLRFLYGVERNRKVFRRLFPPELFAQFLDIGHYNMSLAPYTQLAQSFEELSERQKQGVSAALDDVRTDHDSQLRTVRGYVILEMIGRGAFGAVYKARRARGDVLVALKELPLADIAIFGASDAERTAGVCRMSKEIEILSSLSHPNIVQYYESFTEGSFLYISMELVEGVSLLDHLNSLAEKNRRMPEADIWQVFIAICPALHYIHSTKHIVHRDLTPSNLVLGQGADGLRNTKITDFGLAKRLSKDAVAHSIVGTMPYTCPEIIQQGHYTEKADIWSLGCVLYHMLMLKPPFDGTNPLSVASKIVEGSYPEVSDPLQGPPYSDKIKGLVKAMICVDAKLRPSAEEVGATIAVELMRTIERLTLQEQKLNRALQLERTTPHRHPSFSDQSSSPTSRSALPSRQLDSRYASPFSTNNGTTVARLVSTGDVTMSERLGSSGSEGSLGGAGLASLSTRTVAISAARLRPVNDPLAQILLQLHKVMWVDQLPPGLEIDLLKRAVECFRRILYGPSTNAGTLKQHIVKLMTCQPDIICDVAGRPVDFGPVRPNDAAEGATGDGSLTYEQLYQIVETMLNEKGYYNQAVPEQELLNQLPPSGFNITTL